MSDILSTPGWLYIYIYPVFRTTKTRQKRKLRSNPFYRKIDDRETEVCHRLTSYVSAFECVGGFCCVATYPTASGELLKNCKPRIPRLLSQDRPGEDCGKRIDALMPHACYLQEVFVWIGRQLAFTLKPCNLPLTLFALAITCWTRRICIARWKIRSEGGFMFLLPFINNINIVWVQHGRPWRTLTCKQQRDDVMTSLESWPVFGGIIPTWPNSSR